MKTQFNYKPSNPITGQIPLILMGLAVIIIPIVYPFNIGLGRKLVLLPHPYSAIVLAIIGVLLLIMAFNSMRKNSVLAKQPCPIIIEDGKLSFSVVKKGAIVVETAAIADIVSVKFDDEDKDLTVQIGMDFHKFDMDCFDTEEQFNQFRALVSVQK